jgi:hypothetical protein
MVWQSTSPGTGNCDTGITPDKGFGFQLNANSPSDETVAYQQYVIALFGGELIGSVNNWPLSLDASPDHSRGLMAATDGRAARVLDLDFRVGV